MALLARSRVHLILAIVVAFVATSVWRNWPEAKQACRVIHTPELAKIEGGKATMSLGVVPRDGSCITVAP